MAHRQLDLPAVFFCRVTCTVSHSHSISVNLLADIFSRLYDITAGCSPLTNTQEEITEGRGNGQNSDAFRFSALVYGHRRGGKREAMAPSLPHLLSTKTQDRCDCGKCEYVRLWQHCLVLKSSLVSILSFCWLKSVKRGSASAQTHICQMVLSNLCRSYKCY